MTKVSRFSRQNDAGLRALNVVQWENLVLVVALVLESKGPYYLTSEHFENQITWLVTLKLPLFNLVVPCLLQFSPQDYK